MTNALRHDGFVCQPVGNTSGMWLSWRKDAIAAPHGCQLAKLSDVPLPTLETPSPRPPATPQLFPSQSHNRSPTSNSKSPTTPQHPRVFGASSHSTALASTSSAPHPACIRLPYVSALVRSHDPRVDGPHHSVGPKWSLHPCFVLGRRSACEPVPSAPGERSGCRCG